MKTLNNKTSCHNKAIHKRPLTASDFEGSRPLHAVCLMPIPALLQLFLIPLLSSLLIRPLTFLFCFPLSLSAFWCFLLLYSFYISDSPTLSF